MQWTSVKPAERALEKLVRSYDLDPSRLLDACRETLAYDRPAAIAAALDAIAADGELVVVRVKNRLDPHPDGREHVGSGNNQVYPIVKRFWTLCPPPYPPTSSHTHRDTQ